MGQCGSNQAPSDTTLTPDDIENVQKTWKQVHEQWEAKYGVPFFLRLFKHYEKVKEFFQKFSNLSDAELAESPELMAHVMLFGSAVTGFVDNLTDTNNLVSLIHKMTDNHTARGVTLPYFKSALQELLNYLTDTLKPAKSVRQSWAKTVAIIENIITDHINKKA